MIIKDGNQRTVCRRGFLQKALLAITGGTILTHVNTSQSIALSTPTPALTSKQTSSIGYHETKHIRNYYKTAGL